MSLNLTKNMKYDQDTDNFQIDTHVTYSFGKQADRQAFWRQFLMFIQEKNAKSLIYVYLYHIYIYLTRRFLEQTILVS